GRLETDFVRPVPVDTVLHGGPDGQEPGPRPPGPGGPVPHWALAERALVGGVYNRGTATITASSATGNQPDPCAGPSSTSGC
ncbi:hypothetical protein ACWDBC_11565, partial [Streptomyces parvus]